MCFTHLNDIKFWVKHRTNIESFLTTHGNPFYLNRKKKCWNAKVRVITRNKHPGPVKRLCVALVVLDLYERDKNVSRNGQRRKKGGKNRKNRRGKKSANTRRFFKTSPFVGAFEKSRLDLARLPPCFFFSPSIYSILFLAGFAYYVCVY